MYNNKYILSFENDLNEVYEIYFDFLNYIGVSQPLFGTDDCLTLRSTGGDEDKMSPILGTEALINIVVGKITVGGVTWDNDTLTISDLIAQHDNDIRVTIYKDKDYSKSVFQGFIVVEDNSQPFLDPPFVLSVRALDGLGLLKGVDFTDTEGNIFSGSLTPVSWLAQILNKTGQTLNIRVYFNFYNSLFVTVRPPEGFTINARTFLTGQSTVTTDPTVDLAAGEADDCYTALEKIVRCMRCRLFQEDGVWNLVNLDEYANPLGPIFYEYSLGTAVDGIIPVTCVARSNGESYDINVGSDQIIHPVQDDATRALKLATKWEKLSYSYDQSLNKICNQDLTQGNRNATYDGTIPSSIYDQTITPAVTFNTQGYDAFCLPLLDSNTVNQYLPGSAPHKNAYIRQIVDSLGFSIDRFLVIEQNPATYNAFLRSSVFQADINDIVQLTFSWRTYNNVHTTAGSFRDFTCCALYLAGEDGTFWALDDVLDGSSGTVVDQYVWRQTDSNYIYPNPGFSPYTPQLRTQSINDTGLNWNSVSINTTNTKLSPYARIPISGDLTVLFTCQCPVDMNADVKEVWFQNINVTILSFLQGSYVQLKGDFNYASSNNNIKQTYSEDIQISDSPKRYFKGAILQPDGKTLMPIDSTNGWRRRGGSDSMRFTQAMERVLFNNLYRQNEKIEGSFRGLTYVDKNDVSQVRQAGYLGSYFFSDHPEPTKKFILTSFEKDYGTGIGRHVFVEILEDQNDAGFPDPTDPAIGTYDFQYVFQ